MATDKDYAPLSILCVRALCDKMYDKRKAAALEIEKLTKECVQVNNHMQITKLLNILGVDFAMSQNPNMRKGGLIGLAAMAIGLGEMTGRYVCELVDPILNCMTDTDSRVRFYACESLYNVTKVARDDVLPMFNQMYVAMNSVVSDLDQSVRTAAELLDRLLKDIITEHTSFKVANFVPVLKEKMYSKDQFARQFGIGWVGAMHKVPDTTIANHMPELIDPMFIILTDERPEIYVRCGRELDVFLSIVEKVSQPEESLVKMINVLVVHVQSDHIRLQTAAVRWLRAFSKICGPLLFPYISGILTAILPNCGRNEERRRQTSEEEDKQIMQLSIGLCKDLMVIVDTLSRDDKAIGMKNEAGKGHLEAILDVLVGQLVHGRVEAKIGALKWIYHLFTAVRAKMLAFVDKIFPVLMQTLSDSTDEVVMIDIEIFAVICDKKSDEPDQHFEPFLHSLVRLFAADRCLLEAKGPYIVRQLCVLLNAEDIYRQMALLVLQETDLKFARIMVEYLNTILFTTMELFPLRQTLKNLATKESLELFQCLYRTWSHSCIATVSLCLLSGFYGHTLDLVKVISEQEVTMELLLELDRLIQLIESPIFSHLRCELLDCESNADLIRALYGLMNLMPQSQAYKRLSRRLSELPPPRFSISSGSPKETKERLDFASLTVHFKKLQLSHYNLRYEEVSDDVITKKVKILNLDDDKIM